MLLMQMFYPNHARSPPACDRGDTSMIAIFPHLFPYSDEISGQIGCRCVQLGLIGHFSGNLRLIKCPHHLILVLTGGEQINSKGMGEGAHCIKWFSSRESDFY